jgi:DNA-binding response OmpR family regulator
MKANAKRILVADDYAGLRGLLCVILEQRGYEVLTADTGAATIEVFRTHRPAIVVLDLHMPDMKGFDVLVQLLAMDPHARIIIHSGRDIETVRERALALGASEVFQKGASLTTLADFIEGPATIAGSSV